VEHQSIHRTEPSSSLMTAVTV